MSQRIAKYEVLEKIAEGGFGVVYKARDPFIKRLVAIKTCSVADQEMARRFFREAEIAGRFDHPNVTIVHDFGVEDETAYLVQEYLSGEDLLQKIRRRDPLPLAQKIDYLLQVAAGLAYAHSQQVIHRDIKPANLRVLEGGQVKILDFGIAKLATSTTQLTQKGMAVGTLGYLSPEQLRDQELDTRTDIFSYGVVAYELLTYTRPFQGKQLSVLMDEILNRNPLPVSQLVPDCPPALALVVSRCLEKNRDRRYQSFQEVMLDLEEVRRELSGKQQISVTPLPAVGPAIGVGDGGPATRPIRLPPPTVMSLAPTPPPPPAPSQAAASSRGSAPRAVAPPHRPTSAPPSSTTPPRMAAPAVATPAGMAPTAVAPPVVAPAAPTVLLSDPLPPLPAADVLGGRPAAMSAPAPAAPVPASPPTPPPPVASAPTPPPPRTSAPTPAPPLASDPTPPPPLASAPTTAPPAAPTVLRDAGGTLLPREPDLGATVPPPAPVTVPPRTPPAASAAQPSGVPPRRTLWLLVAAGAILLVLAIGATGWWLLHAARQRAAAQPAATAAPVPSTAPAPAEATVLVVAAPWGELVSLRDGTGRELPLPAARETPLLLELAPGHYVATLSHPAATATASCEVDAVPGQAATCRVELLPVDAMQYFKEAGWWR